jgi:predicted dehydrogenase
MTPDHLHGVIAMSAMKRGKHVVVHKPIANRLMEAERVIETARSTGVSTHFMPWDSNGSMEQVLGWIRDGSIGTLREIHNWTNRPVWPQYPTIPTDRPPIPEGFDWNLWLGPAWAIPSTHTHAVPMVRFRAARWQYGHYSLWTVFRALAWRGPPASSRQRATIL